MTCWLTYFDILRDTFLHAGWHVEIVCPQKSFHLFIIENSSKTHQHCSVPADNPIAAAFSKIPCSVAADAAVDDKFVLPKTPPLDQMLYVNVCLAKDPSDFFVHISDRPDRPITEWAVTKLAKEVDAFYREEERKKDSEYFITDR